MGLFYPLPVILVNFDIKRPSGDVYRGKQRAGSTKAVVTVNGKRLDPRLDLEEFSRMGFGWGYGGAGPAQLALAILAHAAGDEIARAEWERFRETFLKKLDMQQPFTFSAQDITAFLSGLPLDPKTFIRPVRKAGVGAFWKRLTGNVGGKR